MSEHEIAALAATEAAQAERARISAILTHPAGKAAPQLAHRLAFFTDLTADAAIDAMTAGD